MTDLVKRYSEVFTSIQPCIMQDQGTCGLVSFWYAAQLLTKGTTDIVYPRTRNRTNAGGLKTSSAPSMRKFAKTILGSAQGEILSAQEMRLLVEGHGFTANVASARLPASGKIYWITVELGNGHPVLVPYWAGNRQSGGVEPVTQSGLGSHWSLIIGQEEDEYIYIEPNHPYRTQRLSKTTFMESNRIVDRHPLPRYWYKTHKRGQLRGPDLNPVPATTTPQQKVGTLHQLGFGDAKAYDIRAGGRMQNLANVLVSVGC